MKTNTHPVAPPLHPIAADHEALQPFHSVTIDFITDLPLVKGMDSLMVVVDHDVTKAIVLTIPTTKTINAIKTGALYHSHVY